jgi:hypothetical protein
MKLTEHFTDMVVPFLQKHGFVVHPFGYEEALHNTTGMDGLIRKKQFKKSEAALMVKFSPDFLNIYEDGSGKNFFFYADSKTSITPVFFHSHIRRIQRRAKLPELHRGDIGEIEREAWIVYNRFFPKNQVAIIMAAPYHRRLIVAEWVSNLTALYTHKADENLEAAGSGTPHVNLHLGHMRRLDEFLKQEFGVKVDPELYEVLTDEVKKWDLNKSLGRVNWTQFNNAVNELREEGCIWLKNRRPSKADPKQSTI